jgi:hypothetical protein
VQRLVARDSQQPGGEAARAIEAGGLPPHLEHGIDHHLFGFVRIAQAVQGERIDPPPVSTI